jgi:hypothetical protein
MTEFPPEQLAAIVVCGVLILLLVVPCALCCCLDISTPYYERSCQSTGTCPLAHEVEGARVRVYYARSTSVIGACGCHPWVAVKERGAAQWEIWQVIGWRLYMGLDSCVDQRSGQPDRLWYGQTPVLAGEVEGAQAEAAIPRIREAAANYRYGAKYRLCPGPNSNTFVAHLIRSSGLRIALPPMSIGKDYVYGRGCVQRPPSGTGVQWSLCGCGVLGVTCSAEEGLRVQILMMEVGLNPRKAELHWPGIGTIRLRACCCCRRQRDEYCVDPVRPWPLTEAERAAAIAGTSGWNLEDGVLS